MKKIITLLVLIALIVVGIKYYPSVAKNPVSVISPKNATYLVDGESISLVRGVAEVPSAPGSASKTITKYFGNQIDADINGNEIPDNIFLLSQETGGTGIFYYVAAVLDGKKTTNAVFLGDRIAPQTTEVKDNVIIINYADRAPGDPMSAEPSVGVSKYFIVTGTELQEVKNPKATPLR